MANIVAESGNSKQKILLCIVFAILLLQIMVFNDIVLVFQAQHSIVYHLKEMMWLVCSPLRVFK